MKPPFSVPLVDISAYVTGSTSDARRVVAMQLEHACRTVGFIQILGHGIADATIDGCIGEHLSVKLGSSRAGKPNTTAGPEAERARFAKD